MKSIFNKWMSLTLILTIVISLFAPIAAFAAASLTITGLAYVDTNQPGPASIVDRLTVNPINVPVTINGITDAEITNIYYEVTNINTGKTIINNTNKPVKTNSNEITFTNIFLTEGLNKITVKYGDTSVISSEPGWVYFTPVTNITGLQINSTDFNNNAMYPTLPPYNNVNMSGSALNATQVQAVVNGTVFEPSILNRGNFTFVSNTGRSSDMRFTPGDNLITFIARNGTNYYTVDRSFVYNNGKAFAYNAKIRQNAIAPPLNTFVNMVPSPTLTNSGSNASTNVDISANLKNSITGSVKDYVYADIFTLGTAGNYNAHVDLTNTAAPTVTPSGSQMGTFGSLSTVNYNSTVTASTYYDVFDFNGTFPINANSINQTVVFRFTTSTGTFVDSTYSFNFQDYTLPYVDHAARAITSSLDANLSELAPGSQISEFPTDINIYTNDQADYVNVKIGGADYDDGTNGAANTATGLSGMYSVDATTHIAKVKLQGIRDGNTTIQIKPYKNGASNNAGIKTYPVIISGAPYVIISNLFNGMVVNKQDKLLCGSTPGPCIQGRIVNLPSTEYDHVELSVNNVPVKIGTKNPFDSSISPARINVTDGTFTLAGTSDFGTAFNGDGKKTIKFSLYLQNQHITDTTFDVFVLSDDVPAVNTFIPYETPGTPNKFIAGSKPGSFVTNETQVQLVGEVANSDISVSTPTPRQYSISYRKTGDTSSTPVAFPTGYDYTVAAWPTPADCSACSRPTAPFTQKFATKPILLNQYGDYTFEIIAQNTSGITVSKSITITREPQPYSILSPVFVKNTGGKDQANINKNYETIRIRADKADSVTFGKDLATKDTTVSNQDIFVYEATGLKPGKNEIKFTINRGKDKLSGSLILFHMNTPIEGAQEKQKITNSLKLFNGDMQIVFPKDTKLMKNDRTIADQYLTLDRDILFGIANNDDGIVDKIVEGTNNPVARNALAEPTGRFKAASKRYWIDAGTIPAPTDPSFTLTDALQGTGHLPLEGTQFYSRSIQNMVVPTKSGSLTLKYDPVIRDDAWKYVTVYQYGIFEDGTGNGVQYAGWKNIGGVVDLKNNTITVPIESFGFFQVVYMNDSFDDVTGHLWARDYLDTLYSKGVMTNPSNSPGRFLTEDPISRGEFVTMLVKVFNIPLENPDTASRTTDPNDPAYQGTFSDVRRGNVLPNSVGLYDFKHIEAAARAGIVRGSAQGLFLPASSITRQDAAVMIARAADMKMESDPNKSLVSLTKTFTDGQLIDAYARGAVEAVAKAGFIDGRPNVLLQGQKNQTIRFDPVENMTRAEAAAIAIRVLKQQKKIPK